MKHLLTVLMLFGLAMVGCDDDSASNNTNNVNNLNNTNNTNNVNNTNNINNINNTNNVNNLNCSPACEPWESCEDDGAGGTQCVALECTPACSEMEVCLPNETEGPKCVALSWVHHPITISDPVVNGTSLMAPVDGISFGYNPEDGIIATSFGRDVDNAALTHLWIVHEDTGVHEKFPLTGDVFAETENFCNGEDWCQFISFDPDTAEYVVTGPLASGIMRVNALGAATMTTTSGPRPSNSNISYTYRFDWDARFLYVYGYLGPSDFGATIHR
ncbi:hypothetical protein KKF84_11240, partial [Myxococcota bacterium]|nr:hypothetical protein [Myxococcota bacterium]